MASDGATQLLSDTKAVPGKHDEVPAVAAGSDITTAEPIKKTSGVRRVAHMLSIRSIAVNGTCKSLLQHHTRSCNLITRFNSGNAGNRSADPIRWLQIAKLRARMESLRKHTRPEQDLAAATRDLASSSDSPRPVPEMTFLSGHQQSDRLQSSSGASSNQLTNLVTTADPPVVAYNKPHLPSRTSASSLGWDRRFRNAGVSAHLVNDKKSSQPSDPAPKEDAAAAERSLHQKDARSVAQVK